MATTRVYILAKELGVKSTAIVQKCQAEGLDVKNHMSTISAGLAATIREWFSEGENVTTLETAERIDLSKVRIKKKVPKRREKTAKKPTRKAAGTTQLVTEEKPPSEQEPEKISEEEKTETLPPEPKPILPAGPKLKKPKPAKLAGPRVVRVEKPERVRPRKAKPRPPKPGYDEPMVEPLMSAGRAAEESRAKDAALGGKDGKTKIRRPGRAGGLSEVDARRQRLVRRLRQRDIEERRSRLEAAGGERLRLRPSRKIETGRRLEAVRARPEKVAINEPITVKDLSAALAVKASDIIGKLMQQGTMAAVNHVINTDIAELIALEFGTELVVERKQFLEEQLQAEFESRPHKNLQKRPAVVTMLGHVDHGKTSLLDRIRSTNVTAGEAGGITQHIGAYQASLGDRKVTFLDTPGHEAFTAMRARGANMTDVVVLVVAADDGVMPQTIEAIHHARAAEVPMIVALNKIDLPGVDLNRIYGQLAEQGLAPTEWSGEAEIVKTSAVTGEGIGDLIEHIDYVAELKELKADSEVPATGWVIDAKMTSSQGAVATVLIKEGRLNKGDVVLAGAGYGRIRTLRDGYGESIETAISSMPVEISGLSDVPQAGDRFYCLEDINRAKQIAEENKMRSREQALAQRAPITLDNLFSQIEAGNVKELGLIIRADVQGSVDVLIKYLSELSTDEVKVKILHSAVGGITEGDVVLAEASGAIIIGFNVVADDYVAKLAEAKGIDIRLYNVIYRISEDIRDAMVGLLEPVEQEKQLGRLTVREIFKISGVGTVAGCYVTGGLVNKNAKLRMIRDNIVLKDNCTIESLRHFKEDVRQIKAGMECGVKLAGFDDIKVDDVLEAYEIVQVAREL